MGVPFLLLGQNERGEKYEPMASNDMGRNRSTD